MGCGLGLGQYPGEKEITFPPFTCLESDGDPRVERSPAGEVVVFPLKVPLASLPPPPLPHRLPNAAPIQGKAHLPRGLAC